MGKNTSPDSVFFGLKYQKALLFLLSLGFSSFGNKSYANSLLPALPAALSVNATPGYRDVSGENCLAVLDGSSGGYAHLGITTDEFKKLGSYGKEAQSLAAEAKIAYQQPLSRDRLFLQHHFSAHHEFDISGPSSRPGNGRRHGWVPVILRSRDHENPIQFYALIKGNKDGSIAKNVIGNSEDSSLEISISHPDAPRINKKLNDGLWRPSFGLFGNSAGVLANKEGLRGWHPSTDRVVSHHDEFRRKNGSERSYAVAAVRRLIVNAGIALPERLGSFEGPSTIGYAPAADVKLSSAVAASSTELVPWVISQGWHQFLKPNMKFEVIPLLEEYNWSGDVMFNALERRVVFQKQLPPLDPESKLAGLIFSRHPSEYVWTASLSPEGVKAFWLQAQLEPSDSSQPSLDPFHKFSQIRGGESFLAQYREFIEKVKREGLNNEKLEFDQEFLFSFYLGGDPVNLIRFHDEKGVYHYFFTSQENSRVGIYPSLSSSIYKRHSGPLSFLDIRKFLKSDESSMLIHLGPELTVVVEKAAGESNSVYEQSLSDKNILAELQSQVLRLLGDKRTSEWLESPGLTEYEGDIYKNLTAERQIFQQLFEDKQIQTHQDLRTTLGRIQAHLRSLSKLKTDFEVVAFGDEIKMLLRKAHRNPRILDEAEFSNFTSNLINLISYRDFVLRQILLVQTHSLTWLDNDGYQNIENKIRTLTPQALLSTELQELEQGLGLFMAATGPLALKQTESSLLENSKLKKTALLMREVHTLSSIEDQNKAKEAIWSALQTLGI